MNRTYLRVTVQESAVFSGHAGSTPLQVQHEALLEDIAAETATREACHVSATLAAAALSLTQLRPDAMHGLLQHP